jgi:hydroxyacylglutathione hydrolase
VFVGGCGKFFEGTAADMVKAVDKFKAYPDDTEVYVGHEITTANYEWASKADPDNKDIADRLTWAKDRVASGQHTVPSTVGEEKRSNIFIRAAEMMAPLGVTTVEESMHILRDMKDNGVTSRT